MRFVLDSHLLLWAIAEPVHIYSPDRKLLLA
jgi:hypothetical protein